MEEAERGGGLTGEGHVGGLHVAVVVDAVEVDEVHAEVALMGEISLWVWAVMEDG